MCYGWTVPIVAFFVQKLVENLVANKALVFILITNTLMPIVYFLFYKIKKFFRVAAILKAVECAFSIAMCIINSFYENQIVYIGFLTLTQILSIIFEFCFIKGITDIFKGYNEEKFCKKWDFILYAMMVYIIPKSVLQIATALNLQNHNIQLAIEVFNMVVLLLGLVAVSYYFVYTVKSIVYLWKSEK